MVNFEPLSQSKHARLRIGSADSYGAFRETTLVPIILEEIPMVAREYPIIFPEKGADLPCVLTGVQPNTNAFVDESGHWEANYIPLDVRKYPFGLTPASGEPDADGQTRYTLCINPTAEAFADLEGARVFQPNGELSHEAKVKSDYAQKLITKAPTAKAMVQALDDAGLLVPRHIQVNLGMEKRNIQGFRVVDEKKLNGLSDEAFAALRNMGLLPLIYAQLMSMANFRLGRLSGQIASTTTSQASSETSKKSSSDIDLSMFADDGDFEISH